MIRSRSNEDNNNSLNRQAMISKLEKDKLTFLKITREANLSDKNNYEFWNIHQSEMPILSDLARKLLCILSSSACIERFFSICGVICTNRRGNMNPNMIRSRSLIKVNLDLIEDTLI